MDDFVSVLKKVKSLIIYKTYSAREKYNKSGSGKLLYFQLKKTGENNVLYAFDKKTLINALTSFTGKEKVVFVGAGDICQLANKIKDKM